jgi:para-nitrobenzyl esterase
MVDSGFSSVYAYRFDWDGLPRFLGTDLARLLGAAHGFELPFLFGNFELGSSVLAQALFPESSRAARERLSAQMMSYWTEFARTGRPGRGRAGDQPEWRPWSGAPDAGPDRSATLLVLDEPADGGVRLARVALSRDHVLAAVAAEPGLGPDEKCALFGDLYARSPDWDVEQVRRIRRRGCIDFPAVAPLR